MNKIQTNLVDIRKKEVEIWYTNFTTKILSTLEEEKNKIFDIEESIKSNPITKNEIQKINESLILDIEGLSVILDEEFMKIKKRIISDFNLEFDFEQKRIDSITERVKLFTKSKEEF